MKKFLLPLLVVILAMSACSDPHYSIKGTVKGAEGNALLLVFENGKMDTLAKAPIENGTFLLKGVNEEPRLAYLTIEGERRAFLQLILENANYTALYDAEEILASEISSTIASQKLLNEFQKIKKELGKVEKELMNEYSEAQKANDKEKISEIVEIFENNRAKGEEEEQKLLLLNKDNFVSAIVLTQKMRQMELEPLSEIYDQLGEDIKSNKYGQEIAEHIAKMKVVAIGQIAPDFTLDTPEGKPLSLYELKGKVKVIDFWASWCGPCRRANPEMVKLYNKYNKKGLEILGVSLDRDRDAWLKGIKDDKLTWKHVSDLQFWNSAAAQLYMVRSIPHLVILDADNKIVAKNLHGEELENKIIELLK